MPLFQSRADKLSASHKEAYVYYRDEIKREDGITHNRLVYSITLQGFLVAAVTLLLSNGVADNIPTRDMVVQYRQIALALIILLGIIFSALSVCGIAASMMALENISAAWDESAAHDYIKSINYPDIKASKGIHNFAKWFPILVILLILVFWSACAAAYVPIIILERHLPFLPVTEAKPVKSTCEKATIDVTGRAATVQIQRSECNVPG